MNRRLVPLLACLVGLACAGRQPAAAPAAPSPKAEPADRPTVAAPARPIQGPPPLRTVRLAELWTFRPEGTLYDLSASVEALQAGDTAFALSSTPIWKGDRPTAARWAGDLKLVLLDPVAYPGRDDYQTLVAVVQPTRPARVGERLQARYHLEFRDVPYLHRNAGGRRLLSLTLPPRKGVERQDLLFAFPENREPVQATDLRPTEVATLRGWRVYRYEISRTVQAIVHLAFDLTAAPGPAPTLEELLPEGQRAKGR